MFSLDPGLVPFIKKRNFLHYNKLQARKIHYFLLLLNVIYLTDF